MKTINDLLNYSNMKIVQNTDWFNFSLDSVLLANFVKVKKDYKIIDFCTGNCPIPLILSTKTKAKIIGVELQKEVFSLACESVKINNLENQIDLLNSDVKDLSKYYETDTFDLITCNPPYFKYDNNDNINDNMIKAIARHEIKLTLNDIFVQARKILKNGGKIALVHRSERLIDVLSLMRQNNIEPKRLKFIYPFENSISNLVLIEGVKNANPGIKVETNIIVHDNSGNYSKEVIKMFGGYDNED